MAGTTFEMPITYLSKDDLVKQLCMILKMEFVLTGNSYLEFHTVVKQPGTTNKLHKELLETAYS